MKSKTDIFDEEGRMEMRTSDGTKRIFFSTIKNQHGKIGWILLWALGIPIPVLLVLFVLRGCT